MKINNFLQLKYHLTILISATLFSCLQIKKLNKPAIVFKDNGSFFKVRDGSQIFIFNYQQKKEYESTLFIISGITGINHNAESDVIELLSNNRNRIVIIHPRGTGYSDGERGDITDFSNFVSDYVEIIKSDKDYHSKQHKIILFGHSMSTAVLLAIANKIENIDGVILINPPYILKRAKGMSPGFRQYLKYGWYYIFKRHKPIVNMVGDPTQIENEDDKNESELRTKDSLLVKYFSMYMMVESRKLIKSMLDISKTADYPLLLIYGEKDNIVEKKGCDMIFDAWKSEKKQYVLIKNGTHGKSTVILSKDTINNWINEL